MKEEQVIQLGDEKQWLRFVFHTRPFSTSSDAWDRDVLICILEVFKAAFQGKIQFFIWPHELEELSLILSLNNFSC